MPKNSLGDLRNHLFAAIEGLMDEDNPMDLDRAETVAIVAQVVVNSAKVESDFLKHIGETKSSFLNPQKQANQVIAIQPKQLGERDCFSHAEKNGHTKKEAEDCENFSVGCPECPFDK